MAVRSIDVSDIKACAHELAAGDEVVLNGVIYTARDAAHKRIFELLDKGQPLPFEIENAVIYYAGPTPAKGGMAIGSCGPTTSGRMDIYTPRLLDMGLAAMIGKGERSAEVVKAIVRNKAIYFCALGGAGALYARYIKSAKVVAFGDLGCESIKRLEIENFPLIVGVDCSGRSIFETGRKIYKIS